MLEIWNILEDIKGNYYFRIYRIGKYCKDYKILFMEINNYKWNLLKFFIW